VLSSLAGLYLIINISLHRRLNLFSAVEVQLKDKTKPKVRNDFDLRNNCSFWNLFELMVIAQECYHQRTLISLSWFPTQFWSRRPGLSFEIRSLWCGKTAIALPTTILKLLLWSYFARDENELSKNNFYCWMAFSVSSRGGLICTKT